MTKILLRRSRELGRNGLWYNSRKWMMGVDVSVKARHWWEAGLCRCHQTLRFRCQIGRTDRQKATVVPTSNLSFMNKTRGTKWKQTNCCWEKHTHTHTRRLMNTQWNSLYLAYFRCLPMPPLVVCERVEVDKVRLGLWSGWAEHQAVLPSLHLLHLERQTVHVTKVIRMMPSS